MAYELDGNGKIHVFAFTVTFNDDAGSDGSSTRCFTDYAAGWDWARQEGRDWADIDAANRYDVAIDDAWVEYTDAAMRAWYAEHETDDSADRCAEGWD